MSKANTRSIGTIGRTDGRTNGQTNERTDGRTDEQTNERTNERMNEVPLEAGSDEVKYCCKYYVRTVEELAVGAEGAEVAVARPDRMHDDRVDPRGEEERVARVRGHLAALRDGAAHDGGRGGGEGELEEPRVVGVLALEVVAEDPPLRKDRVGW